MKAVDLETIERGSARRDRPSILFVHGYWQAGWTWDEFVMPALEQMGHHCVAVSLRGHGGSEGRIRGTSIADYVNDVSTVVSRLPSPPLIVGHSMGGFVTQHYLAAGHDARGFVLVSTVPRQGAWRATWKAARRNPLVFARINATLDVGPLVATSERARRWLVASESDVDVDRFMPRLESASYKVFLGMLLNRPNLSAIDIPGLVVGGTEDALFDEDEWSETANALGVELSLLEGVGHQPMWEKEAIPLIDVIDGFVATLT